MRDRAGDVHLPHVPHRPAAGGPERVARSGKRDCRSCDWEYRPSRDGPSGSDPSQQVGLDNW